MQFDVYPNTNSSTKKRFPYLLDVQADLLESLGTRVVIPLTLKNESKDRMLTQLMPLFRIRGKTYVGITPQMAGVSRRELGEPLENLSEFRTEIVAAIDMLFTGV